MSSGEFLYVCRNSNMDGIGAVYSSVAHVKSSIYDFKTCEKPDVNFTQEDHFNKASNDAFHFKIFERKDHTAANKWTREVAEDMNDCGDSDGEDEDVESFYSDKSDDDEYEDTDDEYSDKDYDGYGHPLPHAKRRKMSDEEEQTREEKRQVWLKKLADLAVTHFAFADLALEPEKTVYDHTLARIVTGKEITRAWMLANVRRDRVYAVFPFTDIVKARDWLEYHKAMMLKK